MADEKINTKPNQLVVLGQDQRVVETVGLYSLRVTESYRGPGDEFLVLQDEFSGYLLRCPQVADILSLLKALDDLPL